jgi:hypothetical protein
MEGYMAEMGLGYGSEYQLLRFLGHHRNELNNIILENKDIGVSSDYHIEWLDYPKDKSRKSLDGEYMGIDFFPPEIKNRISNEWKNYWPGRGPNWDGIIQCSPFDRNSGMEDIWIIVEAKAHLKELKSPCKAEDKKSIEKIDRAFVSTQNRFHIVAKNSWMKEYYQFANRLAFVNFLLNCGIQCSLLNIYFINGWPNKPQNVTTSDIWKKAIRDEYSYLNINDNAKKYISEIFVKC